MLTLLSTYAGAFKLGAAIVFVLLICLGIMAFRRHEQQIGYDKAVAEYTTKALKAEIEARTKERELNVKLEEAQNEAAKRDIQINELRDNLNATSDRLLSTISSLRRKLPSATCGSAVTTADTSLELLNECAARYSELAEKADRHVSDVITLQESWPK